MRKFRSIFPFVFCIFFVVTAATAQYRSDLWTTENGLPQNTVTSILQTGDGYIWFGTFGGLVRFDGIKFKIFDTINAPAFKTNRITGLSESKDGTLWIGGQNGSLLSYKDEIFTTVIEKPVAQRTPLQAICAGKNGAIWIPGSTGLERYAPDASGKFIAEHIELPNEPKPQISSIVEDGENDIWISTLNGLFQYQNGTIQAFFYRDNFALPPDDGKNRFLTVRIFIDREKRLWLTSNHFLARFESGKIVPVIQKKDANFSIVENAGGSFLLKSDDKVYRFADDKIGELLIDEPDTFARFRGMITDREGNLWLGTTGKGLLRYKQQTARTFGKADGLTDSDVFFVFEDRDKNVWIGSDYLYEFRDGKFEVVETNGRFTSAFQTKDGTLWFGRNDELLTYKDGKFTNFTKESNIQSRMIFEDRKGTLWFPTADGLTTLSDGKRERFFAADGFINSVVQSIVEDREGGIWFAMSGGASRFKDGIFTNYTSKDGLSNDNVRDVYEDRDGVIWLGTYGGGLNRYKDGKFFAATTREGMNEDIVSRILVDEKDNFWLLGNRGVSVISRSALNDLADGKIKTIACASYGVSDGMANSEGNGGNFPAGWRASDGRFWFPSIQGVIVIDPKFSDLPPPPVFIEDVFLAGKQIESKSNIEVAPDTGNLEIHYTGLHFTKPEQVKFKYKLEGFDADWIEVGARRTAYYTQIPPGNYRFLVTASTTNGVWSEQLASKTIVVLSNPVWKKGWFIFTASLFVIAVIVVFYRLRLVQLEKSRQRQQAFSRQLIESQEAERKRIAGELHDGLGQTLLIIKNRAFLGTKAKNLEIANEQFSEISASSGAAINQAREIAYFLRPSQLERLGLTSAIEEMITQADESSEIGFECEIDSLDNFFSPGDEINFFRIVQESVNNVLKHSKASKAEVFAGRDDDKIELLVQDNGKGFAAEKPSVHGKSGFGLIGMEERVRILGGTISIDSEKGKGTKVFVEIKKRA